MPSEDTHQYGTETERVIETVASWSGITVKEGRFNATSFQIDNKEIGHIHIGGTVDISYPPPLRDQLIADGRTEEHHFASNSPTGTTFYTKSEDDIDNAIWLFRLSYLHCVWSLQKREKTNSSLTEIAVKEELDKLDPSDALRNVFETTAVASS